MPKEPLIIVGFGGNAIDFFDTISYNYDVIGFVDDNEEKQECFYKGIRVYGRAFLERHDHVKVICIIGSEKTYKKKTEIIQGFGIPVERYTSAIHPQAIIGSSVSIGYNVVIMPGVAVTSNAVLGNHIMVLANTALHHDVKIGDYTMIGSNVVIAGHTMIGQSCYVGSGSSVINGISIGDYSLIGMGSNVLRSIPSYSKVVGNPAREIKAHSSIL